MLRNYLITALRNLERNWLYAGISILGLAVAFAAAILIAQFVRGEFSYDTWIADYRQVYKVTERFDSPGQPATTTDQTQSALAGALRLALPGVVTARLVEDTPRLRSRPSDKGTLEPGFAWVDPDIFKVFPLPALAGNPSAALQQPDTVVITRSIARKYFGRDLPIGETLQVRTFDRPPGASPLTPRVPTWHSMRVTAVLKDLPSNSNLTTDVFASGRSAYAWLTQEDAHPSLIGISNFTFARTLPTQSASDLGRALNVAARPVAVGFAAIGIRATFHPLPIADIHFIPFGMTESVTKPVGSRTVSLDIAGGAALILLVAGINFVTLMTARASRRGVEVGVRKALGARRADLMIQFIGEGLIQVGLSALIGAALAELLIRPFGAFTQRGLSVDYLHDPMLLGALVGAALAIGLLASTYPALLLSSFRPAAVLKGGVVQTTGSSVARQALVVVQFAILLGLIVTAATVYRQTRFALAQGLGGDSKLILRALTDCSNAFPQEVRRLPGVAAAACSSTNALNTPESKNATQVQLAGRSKETFALAPVDFGFFELYDIRPVAGRLFQPSHGEDQVLDQPNAQAQPTVILNETAARKLGFTDPRAAVGRRMIWSRFTDFGGTGAPSVVGPSRIIGVVPDVLGTVRNAADPTFYFVFPKKQMNVLSIRLTGRDVPQTLQAIARTWKRTDPTDQLHEVFWSQYRLTQYLDIIIQGTTIAGCALLAVLIACVGLFALSAYTTERRTKEIGIRKVMGASTSDVVKLLVWQFTIPVLWAIAVALPLGFLAMNHWLHGFVYHVNPSPWTFVLAAIAAVAIAWATVIYQSYVVARAKPAGALRYE